MISIGNNVANINDALKKITVRYLCDAIRNPKPDIVARIRQLRIVKQLNPSQYANLKKTLPYFVCAMFNPPYRKTENFAYTEYFIIDIDKVSDKGLVVADLKQRLSQDSRVMMCFTSPSGDGLKVMMKLSERCYDAAVYKIFYRLFVEKFSLQYALQQVVDTKTCDVARACFISIDSALYFNPNSEPVDLKQYIDAEGNTQQALELKHETEKKAKEQNQHQPKAERSDPDKATMDLIRQTLNPNAKINKQKPPVYVPAQLEEIMDDLSLYITERGISITEVRNISYGKKLRFKIGLKQAEINLFFGKRGFTVVQSPRTGTDADMNQLMAEVVEAFIAEKV